MSVSGLLFRFAGVYIALLLAIVAVFSLLGMKTNSGVNAGALMGAVFAACLWFAQKNRRYLDATEKKTAVLGMWAIDLGLQVLGTLAVGAAAGMQLPLWPMLFAIGLVGVLHAAGIYVTVVFAGRQYAKQAAKGA